MLVGLVWIIPLSRPWIHACISNNLQRFASYRALRLFWFKVASISTPFTPMLFDRLKARDVILSNTASLSQATGTGRKAQDTVCIPFSWSFWGCALTCNVNRPVSLAVFSVITSYFCKPEKRPPTKRRQFYYTLSRELLDRMSLKQIQ
jgi:hypothetical protein